MKKYPSQEKVRKLFIYKNGNLYWKKRKTNRTRTDIIAGSINQDVNYRNVGIDGKSYRYHRLVYIYHKGAISPGHEITHINHDRHDNRIENLLCISHIDKMKNQPIRRDNKSGCTGVRWNKYFKKWEARITVNKKHFFLGVFENKEEAIKNRQEANKIYGFDRNHGKYKSDSSRVDFLE